MPKINSRDVFVELNIEFQVYYGELEQIAPDEDTRNIVRSLGAAHKHICQIIEFPAKDNIVQFPRRNEPQRAA